MSFCHIAPIGYLEIVKGYKTHLTLAHLVNSGRYTDFYREEKSDGSTIIMDNSAYEMYQEGKPMLTITEVLDCARMIRADYVVCPDYPGESSKKNLENLGDYVEAIMSQGFKPFICPQGTVGDPADLMECIVGALDMMKSIKCTDFYLALSILNCPNAYGVLDNDTQRTFARTHFTYELENSWAREKIAQCRRDAGMKIHFLGMIAPNEVKWIRSIPPYLFPDTWDTSSAIWHGLNGIQYDNSPTGLLSGKIKLPVDFYIGEEVELLQYATLWSQVHNNMMYLDVSFDESRQKVIGY